MKKSSSVFVSIAHAEDGCADAKRHGLLKCSGIMRHYGTKKFQVRGKKAAMQLRSQAAKLKPSRHCEGGNGLPTEAIQLNKGYMDAKRQRRIVGFVEKCFGEVCQNRCVTLNLIQGLSMFIKSISIGRLRVCLVARVKRDLVRMLDAFEPRALLAIRKPVMTERFPSLGESEHISCAKRTEKNFSPLLLLTYHFSREGKRVAFTLAEVLITLGIIGVVAALTLPSVIEKHQKQVTVSKLKKVYSTLSQFVVRTYADNGAASEYLSANEKVDANKTKQFFEIYWKPYFNGINVKEDGKRFYDKSMPYKSLNGNALNYAVLTLYNSGRVSFSVQDGTIYHVTLMFWDNSGAAAYTNQQEIYVDINGIKPPNKLGKDVFKFSINFDKNIVVPQCGSNSSKIKDDCISTGSGTCCAAKIMMDGWQIKDDYPW